MDFSQCCAIVGSASFDAGHFLREYDAGAFACVVAADGGFASLEAVGVMPDVALGDFDSLGYEPDAPVVERHPVMKDETDLELALMWAHRRGFPSTAVYGALGGRLDQTMATLQTLVHFARAGMCVAAVGEGYVVAVLSSGKAGSLAPANMVSNEAQEEGHVDTTAAPSPCASLDLPGGLEGIVSVCAMGGDARVTERGLLYEVEGFMLACDSSRGVSNEFTGRAAHIEVAEGDALVFLPALSLCALSDKNPV